MGRLCRAILVALLAVTPLGADAQSRFAGQWIVRYEREIRPMHGPSSVVQETARLTLTQHGDSLTGQWQRIAGEAEEQPAPRPIRGSFVRDTARFQIELPAPENAGYFATLGRDIMEFLRTYIHDMPTMLPQFELAARGDSLVGTRSTVSLDRQRTTPGRPATAVRDRP